jgi:hypothetical protein
MSDGRESPIGTYASPSAVVVDDGEILSDNTISISYENACDDIEKLFASILRIK